MSDEYQTNDDLELGSDLDAREFQEEHQQESTSGRDGNVNASSFFLLKTSFSSSSISLL